MAEVIRELQDESDEEDFENQEDMEDYEKDIVINKQDEMVIGSITREQSMVTPSGASAPRQLEPAQSVESSEQSSLQPLPLHKTLYSSSSFHDHTLGSNNDRKEKMHF